MKIVQEGAFEAKMLLLLLLLLNRLTRISVLQLLVSVEKHYLRNSIEELESSESLSRSEKWTLNVASAFFLVLAHDKITSIAHGHFRIFHKLIPTVWWLWVVQVPKSPWSGNIAEGKTVLNSLATAAAVPGSSITSATVPALAPTGGEVSYGMGLRGMVMLDHRFQPIQVLTLLVSTRPSGSGVDMEYKPTGGTI
ncbi:hypothetical protein C5167_004439 [Papaver somniferum]|uniref:Uncharacterized protein n=1 Tax=Papaver somniferum TaxID=3469 RepID=A0A4Y7J8J4_PAPSO|nr:hypothetical protein C5167_004439 [Papaver somniferum]